MTSNPLSPTIYQQRKLLFGLAILLCGVMYFGSVPLMRPWLIPLKPFIGILPIDLIAMQFSAIPSGILLGIFMAKLNPLPYGLEDMIPKTTRPSRFHLMLISLLAAFPWLMFITRLLLLFVFGFATKFRISTGLVGIGLIGIVTLGCLILEVYRKDGYLIQTPSMLCC